jgi:hypothetical protein
VDYKGSDRRVRADDTPKRVALTHYLTEQLHNLGQRKAAELEERWEAHGTRERPQEVLPSFR